MLQLASIKGDVKPNSRLHMKRVKKNRANELSVDDLKFDVVPISDLEEHKAKERCKEDGFTVPERTKKKKGGKSCAWHGRLKSPNRSTSTLSGEVEA